MQDEPDDITFRRAEVTEIVPLRQAVIIAGTERLAPHFEGDADASTRHFAALDGERVVGCASCYRTEYAGKPAWQLRGMATDPDYRGRGIGKRLLAFVEASLRAESDIDLLWCNAREAASAFYLKQGWRRVSDNCGRSRETLCRRLFCMLCAAKSGRAPRPSKSP